MGLTGVLLLATVVVVVADILLAYLLRSVIAGFIVNVEDHYKADGTKRCLLKSIKICPCLTKFHTTVPGAVLIAFKYFGDVNVTNRTQKEKPMFKNGTTTKKPKFDFSEYEGVTENEEEYTKPPDGDYEEATPVPVPVSETPFQVPDLVREPGPEPGPGLGPEPGPELPPEPSSEPPPEPSTEPVLKSTNQPGPPLENIPDIPMDEKERRSVHEDNMLPKLFHQRYYINFLKKYPYVVSVSVPKYLDDDDELVFACNGVITAPNSILIGRKCMRRQKRGIKKFQVRSDSVFWGTMGSTHNVLTSVKRGPDLVELLVYPYFDDKLLEKNVEISGNDTLWRQAVATGWDEAMYEKKLVFRRKSEPFDIKLWTNTPCDFEMREICSEAEGTAITGVPLVSFCKKLVGLQLFSGNFLSLVNNSAKGCSDIFGGSCSAPEICLV